MEKIDGKKTEQRKKYQITKQQNNIVCFIICSIESSAFCFLPSSSLKGHKLVPCGKRNLRTNMSCLTLCSFFPFDGRGGLRVGDEKTCLASKKEVMSSFSPRVPLKQFDKIYKDFNWIEWEKELGSFWEQTKS